MRAAVIEYKQLQHKACQCDYMTQWLLAAEAAAACGQHAQHMVSTPSMQGMSGQQQPIKQLSDRQAAASV